MTINEIPDDIMKVANEKAVALGYEPNGPWAVDIARAVIKERERWAVSAESIKPQNEEQASIIELLVRRTRGEADS